MDLKNFDKQIKTSLEHIEEPFDPNSWLALEKRMDAAFSEEQPAAVEPVDLVVKRSLERIEAPYNAADWGVLNARLNANTLVRRIRYTKIAELVIFLLLLINIEGFLGGFKEVVRPKAPQPAKSTQPMAVLKSKKSGKSHSNSAEASKIGTLAEQVVAFIATPFQSSVNSEIVSNSELPAISANQSVLDAHNFYGTTGIVAFNKFAPLPQSKTPEFAWKTLFDIIPGVPLPITPRSNGLYAASFASYDKNFFKGDDDSGNNSGYSAGIMVGAKKGKWGVETGIAYSHKNFGPKREVDYFAGNQLDGFLGAYVKAVDAEIFSVPVKVTRRIASYGKTSAHAVAGITASVATEKRFTYKLVKTASTSPDPVPGPNPNEYTIPQINNDGYFEGGALKTNAYATAEVGIRVQRPFGKRYVAFVEPSYRQSIGGGFGPNKEQVNTFSFQAGIMAAL